MDADADLGKESLSKHQIQPEHGDEQADAGRDCRTHLARPNSQARTRTGQYSFSRSADHKQDWQSYPVDPCSCYICDYTFIHTFSKSSVHQCFRILLLCFLFMFIIYAHSSRFPPPFAFLFLLFVVTAVSVFSIAIASAIIANTQPEGGTAAYFLSNSRGGPLLVSSSCVTPTGTSTSLMSRINGKKNTQSEGNFSLCGTGGLGVV